MPLQPVDKPAVGLPQEVLRPDLRRHLVRPRPRRVMKPTNAHREGQRVRPLHASWRTDGTRLVRLSWKCSTRDHLLRYLHGIRVGIGPRDVLLHGATGPCIDELAFHDTQFQPHEVHEVVATRLVRTTEVRRHDRAAPARQRRDGQRNTTLVEPLSITHVPQEPLKEVRHRISAAGLPSIELTLLSLGQIEPPRMQLLPDRHIAQLHPLGEDVFIDRVIGAHAHRSITLSPAHVQASGEHLAWGPDIHTLDLTALRRMCHCLIRVQELTLKALRRKALLHLCLLKQVKHTMATVVPQVHGLIHIAAITPRELATWVAHMRVQPRPRNQCLENLRHQVPAYL